MTQIKLHSIEFCKHKRLGGLEFNPEALAQLREMLLLCSLSTSSHTRFRSQGTPFADVQF